MKKHIPNIIRIIISILFIISAIAKLDLTNINCKQVIIDSSVPKYKWEQIKKECHKRDIPFYNVSTQGAYLFEFTSA